ncbi:MAG: S41 family peptidase [candidate division Zixibacteria bacterium]|nr:S41 family peptidase [candidate division Zixibacteria bacterium]
MNHVYNENGNGVGVLSCWFVVALVLVCLTPGQSALAQDITVDAKSQAEIIDSITATLNSTYVFPEVAAEMEQYIRKQYKNKAYKDISNLGEFTEALTTDLREVCHDRHLSVFYVSPERLAQIESDTNKAENERLDFMYSEYNNFDFVKVERLPGNVGYLRLDGFSGYPEAGETAIAAMAFVANCDALIIDLRENGGGHPVMIQLLTSYFFNEPVHLNSFYIRKSDSIHQFWTHNWVPGKRMTDIPLYVLTSSYTFSGAEEFSFNLKNLERATLIGETTGGGAHPCNNELYANLNVQLKVPFGRAINPITGTNWEGTGVEPHIAVAADDALMTARVEAMNKIKENPRDERTLPILDWHIAGLDAQLNPIEVDEAILLEFVGDYGPRHITLEDGVLYYQRDERPKFKMTPMTEDTFWFEKLDYFRMKFIRDEAGQVVEVNGLYDNGRVDRNPRD